MSTMSNNFTPFYQPRVYYFQSTTNENDYYAVVLVDLYVTNNYWIPGGILQSNLAIGSDGINLTLNLGTILTATSPGVLQLQTYCTNILFYPSMPTAPFPTVTASTSNTNPILPPSVGVTKQIKTVKLDTGPSTTPVLHQCRPIIVQSATNNWQNFVSALVDLNGNEAIASTILNGSPTIYQGVLTFSGSGTVPFTAFMPLYPSFGPGQSGQVTQVQLADYTSPALTGTYDYASPIIL